MESVYKLSKYSQKISEACRAKQLDKVMEYNNHELAYINKLSKYFNNQKGGAGVDEVFAAIREAINKQTAKLEEQVLELRRALEKAVKEADQERQGHVDAMQKTQQTKEAKEAELARVTQQLQVLRTTHAQEQGQQVAQLQLQEDLVKTKQELATVTGKNQEAVKTIEQLQRNIKENMTTIQQLQTQSLEMEILNEKLTRTQEEVQKTLKKLQEEKQQQEATTATTAQQAQQDQLQLARVKAELDTTKQELAQAQQERTDAKQELAKVQQALEESSLKLQAQTQLLPLQPQSQSQGSNGGSKRKK
jgi:chromosome segregation ATPase